MFKKLTPVLAVDRIEPVLPLWDALGFTRTAEVPHHDQLGFVILTNGPVEVMYQTFDSIREDEPRSLQGPRAMGASSLFIEVNALADVASRLPKDTEVVVTRRQTPYGSTEMIVRDGAGNIVVFAEMG